MGGIDDCSLGRGFVTQCSEDSEISFADEERVGKEYDFWEKKGILSSVWLQCPICCSFLAPDSICHHNDIV